MKLNEALKIGNDCGLFTLGESLMNIRMHAGSMFSYSDIDKELDELNNDLSALQRKHKLCGTMNTEEVFHLMEDVLI